jgi:hypothetical protein
MDKFFEDEFLLSEIRFYIMKRIKTQKLIHENEIELKRAIIEQIKNRATVENSPNCKSCNSAGADGGSTDSPGSPDSTGSPGSSGSSAGCCNKEESTEIGQFAKKLYRKALTFFHPDKQKDSDAASEEYMRTKKAYATNDVLELIFLLSSADKYVFQINKDEETLIRNELNKVKKEIEGMENSYVYKFKKFNAETQQSIINQLTKANYANHFPT